ncbi:glycosyltransferase family 2 protein, partial [Balneolaceae bacterium ANBcel3]|nr:glycosyltransferase family 2 protein [Balneolaceae bacterium ANBcel3]
MLIIPMHPETTLFFKNEHRGIRPDTVAWAPSVPCNDRVFILTESPSGVRKHGASDLLVDSVSSIKTLQRILKNTRTRYLLIASGNRMIQPQPHAVERMIQVADMTDAGWVYSDYRQEADGALEEHPLIDYQLGSLRDDFDFGPLLLIRTKALEEAVGKAKDTYRYAGWYYARLAISRNWPVLRIPEVLYTATTIDHRSSGEKVFDYVDPSQRKVQIEMEAVCTEHLEQIHAWLPPVTKEIPVDENEWPVEASVVIPVRNRLGTIKEAIRSALLQQTVFDFNVIVVDNYSDDGTTELLAEWSEKEKKLIHVIPENRGLGIGGCWNEAVMHPECGKYAVQLDSDDIYKDETTLRRILEVFHSERCAMVVGSYITTDVSLKEIPPGRVDHREWTPENGHNNALRVNGFGAPRAFYTPVLRSIRFPDVSYGEDYAVCLA